MLIIVMEEICVQEKSALDYFGGFDAYQKRLHDTISKGILKLTIEQLLYIENRSTGRVSGFDSGLIKFVKEPVYVTNKMASRLECPLSFSRLSILGKVTLTEEDKNYWNGKIKKNGAFSTGPQLTPELFVSLEALEESDELAEERNTLGERPNYRLSNC